MRRRRAWRGEGGATASAGCGKVKEAGRKDQRGGEWSDAGEVRYARSSDAGKVSSSAGEASVGGEAAAPMVLLK